MALNKVSMPIAAGSKNEFDLSCDHQTSMNFLLAQPIYYRHVPRGEHFNDVCTGVVRPVGMSTPTFGRLRNNLRAFFVPYRLVYPQYDAGRADVLGYSYSAANIPDTVPRFSAETMHQYFFQSIIISPNPNPVYLYINEVTDATEIANGLYDFSEGTSYYKFNALGRRHLKLLRCLGYDFIPSGPKTFYFDAMALLCYAQLYLDWYANSQYLDSAQIVTLRKVLSYNDPTTPLDLSLSEFSSLLALIFAVVYDTDEYFNAAWDTPVSPTNGQWSMPTVQDVSAPTPSTTSIDVYNNGTPYMKQIAASNTSVGSQYIHDMLQALSNYQRRHALSGAREIDRALADYGFVSDYASLKRAVYIGNRSFDIQIGDVFSTADTSSSGVSNLGEYAGRGFGNGQGAFDYTASEDGMIIVVSTIIPSCGIVQGYDRNNRHLSRFDFYDPNFEIGVQVLEKGEVYVSQNEVFYNGYVEALAERFAYTGRFAEYKRPRSWWTSESRHKSIDAGGDAWNLFRLFDDANFANDITNLTHSLSFTRAVDWDSFNRIFNYIGNDRDKFDCFYHHEVHCQSPMKPLFETYDFKETHKQIKMDINGSKLN